MVEATGLAYASANAWIALHCFAHIACHGRRTVAEYVAFYGGGLLGGLHSAAPAAATALTFVFISFTRLFFRSGSNLDPAEANEVAWRTATQMVGQIGSHWNLAQVPDILSHYWAPFLLFAIGMVVHWLPARFKRCYRLWFAQMPLWGMAVVVVLTVVMLYQVITADLQPFIYFQF